MKFIPVEPKGTEAVFLCEVSQKFQAPNLETVRRIATWSDVVAPMLGPPARDFVLKNPAVLKEIEGEDPELMYTVGVISEDTLGNFNVTLKVWAPRGAE